VWPADETGAARWLLQVLSHLQDRLDAGQSAATISKTAAGLKYAARMTCPQAARILTESQQLRAFQAGVARVRRDDVARRAAAFTTTDLRRLHLTLAGDNLADQRNRALIALGTASALRASSLTSLVLSDITPGQDGALRIRVRHSKTDQAGLGTTIAVLPAADATLDPIRAITRWIAALRQEVSPIVRESAVPLFPRLRGGHVQSVPLISASEAVTDIVRAAVVRAGIADAKAARQYSSHSLRSTFVTLSARAGVSEARIAAITGHRSLSTLRSYDRSSTEAVAQTDYLRAM